MPGTQVLEADATAAISGADFRAEAAILAQLHHPHLLLLVGTCDEDGHRALVTELMEGGSLHDALFDENYPRQLSWQDRVRIAQEAAAGLAYLHSFSPPIVHRDLKPANILLTRCCLALAGTSWLSMHGHALTSWANLAAREQLHTQATNAPLLMQ